MRIQIDHYVFYFNGTSRGTRNGFAHDAALVWYAATRDGDYNTRRATVQYLNRTWENYTFQTAYLKALCMERDARRAELKRDFLRDMGYIRMTAARREHFEKIAAHDERLRAIAAAVDAVKTCGGRDMEYHAITEGAAA